MKVRIVAIGRLKDKRLKDIIDEYIKRLHPFCSLEIIELKDEGKEKEAEKMMKYVNSDCFILSVEGKSLSSEGFKDLLNKKGNITFIIGGPEGFSEKIKRKAQNISLSMMTFTHEMCRLFLIEQIYRAQMMMHNRPYHK